MAKFTMTIGNVGSGKTEWMDSQEDGALHVSFGRTREQMFSLSDYRHELEVSRYFLDECKKGLEEGKDVIDCACNLRVAERELAVQTALEAGADSIKIVMFNESMNADKSMYALKRAWEAGEPKAQVKYGELVKKTDQYCNLISKIMKSGGDLITYFRNELQIPDDIEVTVTVKDHQGEAEITNEEVVA
jgi:hypothetical protein